MRFYVKGQTLTRSGNEIVATQAINFPNVEFEFDSAWDGLLTRVAVFQNVNTAYNAVTPSATSGQTPYGMLLEREGNIWKTHVPYEILSSEAPLKFIVTVYGGSASRKLITTNPVTCEITQSLYDPGQTPGEPTEDLWQQMSTRVDSIQGEVEDGRIDTNGDEWSSLGAAIRGQVGGLKTRVDWLSGLVEDDVEGITSEITDARIDTNDNTWSSLGAAIRGQVSALKTRIDSSQNEIEDARIDTNDNTWSSLGAAIRGQVSALKARYDDAVAKINRTFRVSGTASVELNFYDNKKWIRNNQSNGDRVELTNSNGITAVEAILINYPARVHIKNSYNYTTDDLAKQYYICSDLYKNNTDFLAFNEIFEDSNGKYITFDIPSNARRICFHCNTASKDNVSVVCSNETYTYEYDELHNTREAANKLLSNACSKYNHPDGYPNSWRLSLTNYSSSNKAVVTTEETDLVNIPAGKIIHVTGYVMNATNITIYADVEQQIDERVWAPQILYQYYSPKSDSSIPMPGGRREIDIYAVASRDFHICVLECEPLNSGDSVNAEIFITTMDINTFKYSESDMNTGKKWVNGSDIYTRTYYGYYESSSNYDFSDQVLDTHWNYKYTIIDCEANYTAINAKMRNQTINPGRNYNTSSTPNNKPTLFVQDTNGGGHSSSSDAMLLMVPSAPIGSISYPFAVFYTVTVYYTKSSFTIAPEASKFRVVSGETQLQDTGKSIQVIPGAHSTVVIQTKQPVVFQKMLQTFDKISKTNLSDFTCEIGLYDSAGNRFEYVDAELTDASTDWDGVIFDRHSEDPDEWPTVVYYLRYTITNNGDSPRPLNIGPAMFIHVKEDYINNI